MIIRYNICFLRHGGELLLLNRESPEWMGCWNGVGGKLKPEESPRASMLRELAEETSITECRLTYKGLVTWTVDGERLGGMYLYLGELEHSLQLPYETPVKTPEGILDWKSVEWIMHPRNAGVATNIPIFLDKLLNDAVCYDHHCTYVGGRLAAHASTPIDADTEQLERTNAYLSRAYANLLSSTAL